MIGVRIILVLFLFTAASGQQLYFNYSLTPVTVELDDIVMGILDELAPYVNESNCKLELVKIFETLIPVDNGTNYMFNIEIFCPDNQRSRVCTNVKVKELIDCIDKPCLIDPKEIECITILTGKNSSVLDNYSLTPVTVEIRKVVLESLDRLAEILDEPKCKFELLNIFSAVAQDAQNVSNYMFDIEVYCPSSKVSRVCANVEVYHYHDERNIVLFNDSSKIQCFTIKTEQYNYDYGYNHIAPFTIGLNKTLLKADRRLAKAIDEPGCELEFVKVFETVVQYGMYPGSGNMYMFDIEVYCPRNNVSKVCTNVTVHKYDYEDNVRVNPRGIQCFKIKTGKHSPVLDNYSLTPITIEIRKVVLEILGPLAPIIGERGCKLELVDIFVAVAKVTPFVTEYMFDINVYCPSSKVSKVCVNVKAYESNVSIHHNITCPILYEPKGIQCFEISNHQRTIQ